ncbi:MAG: hypothetical protein A2Y93_05870 [Chloroflexi bacterium RBG_13_68_17]|nr:MAG: hypothetical protein A2Y93_05870 [Chloroflexi bacterium RBG_13_68_17]
MFQALFELMLGKVGRAFLAFYSEYSPFINAAAIVYGGILVYAHNNLRALVRRMEAMIVECARDLGASPDPVLVHSRFAARWKQEHASRTAVIPSRRDLWLTRVPADGLPELLQIRPDYVRMAMHKMLGDPPARSFRPAVYRAWEHLRHQLLIGMRAGARDPDELIAAMEERLQEKLKRGRKAPRKK